jgi:hypothetical protein
MMRRMKPCASDAARQLLRDASPNRRDPIFGREALRASAHSPLYTTYTYIFNLLDFPSPLHKTAHLFRITLISLSRNIPIDF